MCSSVLDLPQLSRKPLKCKLLSMRSHHQEREVRGPARFRLRLDALTDPDGPWSSH